MVEKEKRLTAALLIEDLISGRITNYEYDDRFPTSDADPALRAIYEMVWFSYSDVREHRLHPHKQSAEYRAFVERMVLFLNCDCEYTGPREFIDLFAIPKRLWYWVTRRPVPDLPESWPFDNEQQLRSANQESRIENQE